MRVLLYEWGCSGGPSGSMPAIEREGRMMLESLARDAAKEPSIEIVVLVAVGRPIDLPAQARAVAVEPGRDRAALLAAAAEADWAVIVAPETDHILHDRVRAVREAGGRVLAPSNRVIETATDKQATIDRLAACGVPVPAGRSLAAGASLPEGFRLPAALKHRASCGGDGFRIIRERARMETSGPSRLEAFAEGDPVGVSCLCGPGGAVVLPVMHQRFSCGDAPRYLGSEPLVDAAAAARAGALARRAAAAIGADAGWLGIDMILGEPADGRLDRVLEINPRVTTSIASQSGLFASSIVAAMIDAASDRPVSLVADASASIPEPRCPTPT